MLDRRETSPIWQHQTGPYAASGWRAVAALGRGYLRQPIAVGLRSALTDPRRKTTTFQTCSSCFMAEFRVECLTYTHSMIPMHTLTNVAWLWPATSRNHTFKGYDCDIVTFEYILG